MNSRINLLLKALFIALLINSYFIFANYYAISKNGDNIHLWISGLLALPVLICLLIVPFSLLVAIFKKYRKQSINTFIVSITFFFGAFICIRTGELVRYQAFHQLAERSQPLITAIENHEKDNGALPNTLDDLVPKYLSSVPTTQMGAYPDYEYYVSEKAQSYNKNPWVIVVQTPSGGINWDMFMYFPLQNYPKRGYGGSIELIGKWAYVHE